MWFNPSGLNRALVFRNKLTITGAISLTASEAFIQKNLHRSHAENVQAMKKQTALHLENGVEVPWFGVMAAFGCNYQRRHCAGAGNFDLGRRSRDRPGGRGRHQILFPLAWVGEQRDQQRARLVDLNDEMKVHPGVKPAVWGAMVST